MDAIPLPENDTSRNASIMLTLNNFAIEIQQLPQDNTSFTPNLTQLIMGIGNMNPTALRENVNTTGSVTLPPELTTFQSVAFAVFLGTSLYPPSNVNSSVGSIIIAVSIQNQIVDNLREPVHFTFQKNKVRWNVNNTSRISSILYIYSIIRIIKVNINNVQYNILIYSCILCIASFTIETVLLYSNFIMYKALATE